MRYMTHILLEKQPSDKSLEARPEQNKNNNARN
jgi:hypothetical protein